MKCIDGARTEIVVEGHGRHRLLGVFEVAGGGADHQDVHAADAVGRGGLEVVHVDARGAGVVRLRRA